MSRSSSLERHNHHHQYHNPRFAPAVEIDIERGRGFFREDSPLRGWELAHRHRTRRSSGSRPIEVIHVGSPSPCRSSCRSSPSPSPHPHRHRPQHQHHRSHSRGSVHVDIHNNVNDKQTVNDKQSVHEKQTVQDKQSVVDVQSLHSRSTSRSTSIDTHHHGSRSPHRPSYTVPYRHPPDCPPRHHTSRGLPSWLPHIPPLEDEKALVLALEKVQQEKEEAIKQQTINEWLLNQKKEEDEKKKKQKEVDDGIRKKMAMAGFHNKEIEGVIEGKTVDYCHASPHPPSKTHNPPPSTIWHCPKIYYVVNQNYISIDTLNYFGLPWRRDPDNENLIMILKEKGSYDLAELFRHTRQLTERDWYKREYRRRVIVERGRSRSRSRSRSSSRSSSHSRRRPPFPRRVRSKSPRWVFVRRRYR